MNPPFFKPLFRLQNEQEKGGPGSQQLFEIPLWLMTDNALWYRVGGQKEGVSWRHYCPSVASSSRGLVGVFKNSRSSVVKQSLPPEGFI